MLAATWASSGVVHAIFNFTAFDQTVSEAIGPDCSNAIRAVTDAFTAAWAIPANQTALYGLFNTTPAFLTQTDFAWMLADAGAMGPQYGYKVRGGTGNGRSVGTCCVAHHDQHALCDRSRLPHLICLLACTWRGVAWRGVACRT